MNKALYRAISLCLSIILTISFSTTVYAYQFNGDGNKITEKLLSAIQKSEDTEKLIIIIRYRDNAPSDEEYNRVRDAIANVIFDSERNNKQDLILSESSADKIHEILITTGFSGATEDIINGVNERLSNPKEWDQAGITRFVRYMLVKSVYQKESDDLITLLGVQKDQVLYQSVLMPEIRLLVTAKEVEKISMNESVLLIDLQDSTVYTPPGSISGDANSDGNLNMKDVLAIRKYIAQIDVSINKQDADANKDGNVDMKDVLYIRQVLVYGNIFSNENDVVDFNVEELVNIRNSTNDIECVPPFSVLKSVEDIRNYFEKVNDVFPKNNYDEEFFSNRILVALRVYDGRINKTCPIPCIYRNENNTGLLVHLRNNIISIPWNAQDVILVSLPVSEMSTIKATYIIQENPVLKAGSLAEIDCYLLVLSDIFYL